MAVNTTTFESTLQTKLNDTTLAAKEMLLLGKALESTVGSIAVSDINTAGATKVSEINTVATNTFKTVGGTSILGSGNIEALPSGGTVGQVVTNTGSGTGGWADASGGVLQAKNATYTGHAVVGGSYTGGHLYLSITPKKADSSFLIIANCYFGFENHDVLAGIGFDTSGAAPGGNFTPVGSGGGDFDFATSAYGSTAGVSTMDDWSISSTPAHYLWTPSSNLGTSTRTFQVLSIMEIA